ncbi:MAG: ankyrin repeat domain-containing protein [Tatlockia sp.]|jgi:hypothetical protein
MKKSDFFQTIKQNNAELKEAILSGEALNSLQYSDVYQKGQLLFLFLQEKDLVHFEKCYRAWRGKLQWLEAHNTVLHEAVSQGQIDFVKTILVNESATTDYNLSMTLINQKNDRHETPLEIAIRKGYKEIVALLIKHRVNFSASIFDCNANYIFDVIKLENKAIHYGMLQHPLMVAIAKENKEMVAFLLAYHEQIPLYQTHIDTMLNGQRFQGNIGGMVDKNVFLTVLLLEAIKQGKPEMYGFLLQQGALLPKDMSRECRYLIDNTYFTIPIPASTKNAMHPFILFLTGSLYHDLGDRENQYAISQFFHDQEGSLTWDTSMVDFVLKMHIGHPGVCQFVIDKFVEQLPDAKRQIDLNLLLGCATSYLNIAIMEYIKALDHDVPLVEHHEMMGLSSVLENEMDLKIVFDWLLASKAITLLCEWVSELQVKYADSVALRADCEQLQALLKPLWLSLLVEKAREETYAAMKNNSSDSESEASEEDSHGSSASEEASDEDSEEVSDEDEVRITFTF